MHPLSLNVSVDSDAELPNFARALSDLSILFPALSVSFSSNPDVANIAGQSEEELNDAIHTLSENKISMSVGGPIISYRETVGENAAADYSHKRQVHGTGEFARVVLRTSPRKRGAGNLLEIVLADQTMPKEYYAGISKGIDSVFRTGPIAGFPVVDVGVEVSDCAFHETDSSFAAFEIAGRAALRQCLDNSAVLLEPIMRARILLLKNYVGSVIADLNQRRGIIVDTEGSFDAVTVVADVPLASMFGYAIALKKLTLGMGTYKMVFSHYAVVNRQQGPDDFAPAIGLRA